MKIAVASASLALTIAFTACLPGCDKDRDEMRPDMSHIQSANGLQARDLDEMTRQLAPTLLSIPEITANPNRITVVCKGGNNHLEGDPGRDVSIFAYKLMGLLNTSAARDRIAFVEDRRTLDRLRAEEIGTPSDPTESGSRYPTPNTDPRIVPQFALYVNMRSMRNEKTTYYLCQFQLTSFATGQIVWEGDWDTVTRNLHH